jgi:hypothetical protein
LLRRDRMQIGHYMANAMTIYRRGKPMLWGFSKVCVSNHTMRNFSIFEKPGIARSIESFLASVILAQNPAPPLCW